MSYGAISKNVYPPNSINVVTSSLSNVKIINLNVIKPIPKIAINNFTSNIATARINISANSTTHNRIDSFALYLNGSKTDKTISITVLPTKLDHSNTDSNVNNNDSNNSNIIQSNDKINNIHNKDSLVEKSNRKEKDKYIILLPIILIIIIGILMFTKIMKKRFDKILKKDVHCY